MDYLKSKIFVLFLLLCSGCYESKKISLNKKDVNYITPEIITGNPALEGPRAKNVKVSPDGRIVTYLKAKDDESKSQDIWGYKLTTHTHELLIDSKKFPEKELSEQEKSLRERKRIFNTGIVDYQFDKQGNYILVPISGDIFIYHLKNKKLIQVTQTESVEFDPQFSPLGNYISYLRDGSLYIYNIKNQNEKLFLKASKSPEIQFAVAELIAQEEMARYTGYWWSPDETSIAITRVDETHVESITRTEIYKNETKVIKQKYPRAGKINASVWLGIKSMDMKSEVKWIFKGTSENYLARVQWVPAGLEKSVFFLVQDRNFKKMDLYAYDLNKNSLNVIISERSNTWLNIPDDIIFYIPEKSFFWTSEKTKQKHIYLVSLDGKKTTSITSGDWSVNSLLSFDENKKNLFFSSNKDDLTGNDLWRVDLSKPTDIKKVSTNPGLKQFVFFKTNDFFVETFSNSKTPLQTSVKNLKDEVISYIEENKLDSSHPFYAFKNSIPKSEIKSFISSQNEEIFYHIIYPLNFDKNKKYPLIQYVYGGPTVQNVTNSWFLRKMDFLKYYLAQRGYFILTTDNRGTENRGKKFSDYFYKKFGQVDVEDQSLVLSHVINKLPIDKSRVGVFGHSYGGYLTIALLLKKADLYKVGVAGAPVTDWELYDTYYTEKYMGHPGDSPEAYKIANLNNFASNLKGKLLIAHGTADDNVLFDHSIKLYAALQDKGKHFDIMNYPGSKHGIKEGANEKHYLELIYNYFATHL